MRLNDCTVTCDEVAVMLRCSRDTVQAFVRKGELEAFRLGQGYRVTYRSVQAFIKRRIQYMKEHGAGYPNNFRKQAA